MATVSELITRGRSRVSSAQLDTTTETQLLDVFDQLEALVSTESALRAGVPNQELYATARQRITKRLDLTGQLVPAPVVEEAAEVLACIWQCGIRKGITVTNWRYAAIRLDQAVIDTLIVSARGGDDDL